MVTTDAQTNHRMNIGKAFFRRKPPFVFSAFFACISDRTRVMGMMARVRVSFTVTALSRVWLPRPHMLSQAEAAAVTGGGVVHRRTGEDAKGLARGGIKADGLTQQGETAAPPAH